MLLSYSHKFIFIKTVKTAGTSVEAFLEPYCCPPGHIVKHWTPSLVSDYGVVGRRWPQNDREDYGYYNHMPASDIIELHPDFYEYCRITSVRSPYDRAISMFHYSHSAWRPVGGIPLDEAIYLCSQGRQSELQELFLTFLRASFTDDKHLLTINDSLAVNRWIRYEHLQEDLEELVKYLQLPYQGQVSRTLPTFKQNRYGRPEAPPLSSYLSRSAIDLINEICSWTFTTFGYQFL